MTIAIPSCNPSNAKSLRGVLRVVLAKFLQKEVDDQLPAMVIAYNRTTNMATVQPLVSMVTTLGEIVPRGEIASVPVYQIGGGNFVLNFPVKKGDLGWIKANDRDISLFKQMWSFCTPNTRRMHSFEDGVFYPQVFTAFTIQTPDVSNVVLQTLDGSMRISLGDGNACITDEASYAQSVNCVLDVQSTTRALKFPV